MNATLALSDEEVRAEIRAELATIVRDEALWLSKGRAAARMELDPSTFTRLAKRYGLPKSKLNAKVVRYWAPDVDAMMLAHLVRPAGRAVIEFPSWEKAEKLKTDTLKLFGGAA